MGIKPYIRLPLWVRMLVLASVAGGIGGLFPDAVDHTLTGKRAWLHTEAFFVVAVVLFLVGCCKSFECRLFKSRFLRR